MLPVPSRKLSITERAAPPASPRVPLQVRGIAP
jgi:hypothetical protein